MTHGHHHHHGSGGGHHHHHHHHGGHHHHGHHHHGGHHHHHHHGGQVLPGTAVRVPYLTTTTVHAPLLEPMPHSSGCDKFLYPCLAILILAAVFTFFIFG
nr:uncharacterized protein LOC127312808 [Lolium perenne]